MTATGTEYKSPGDYLAAADVEFAAGNHDAGSTLLTQSVHCALAQLAKTAGKPAETRDDMREFAEWLDKRHGSADGWHARNLRTANGFGDNAKYHFLPDEDIDLCQPLVREFIDVLVSYRRDTAFND